MESFLLNKDGFIIGVTSSPSDGESFTNITPPIEFQKPRFMNGMWVDNSAVKLTPLQFKMCFTTAERIAIEALKATDPITADAYLILDDPRLTEVDLSLASNINLIDYLATKVPALTPARVLEIKSGKML